MTLVDLSFLISSVEMTATSKLGGHRGAKPGQAPVWTRWGPRHFLSRPRSHYMQQALRQRLAAGPDPRATIIAPIPFRTTVTAIFGKSAFLAKLGTQMGFPRRDVDPGTVVRVTISQLSL